MGATSYGSVHHTGTRWIVRGEPFVRARLKRLFARVKQEAADHIALTATPENTRELEWFLQRYPMEIAPEAASIMQRLASEHRQCEVRLASLMDGHVPPVSVELAEPAREYQTFAGQMAVLQRGLLLADDLGIGKTVSAIVTAVLEGQYPVLVVVPAHLPRQWAAAFARFTPNLLVHVIKTSKPYSLVPKSRRKDDRQMALLNPTLPDVLIVSYHKLRGWSETLAGVVKAVVFDEAQQLRSDGTAIYTAAKHVAASTPLRLGLSATPIYNYGGEFFNVIDVLRPDSLGDYSEFLREWCTQGGGDKPRIKDTKAFGAYLRREGIMLRRTRKDVGRELPKLTRIVHEIDADEKALNDLKGNAVALAKLVLAHNEQFKGQKMQAAGEFDAMMRQATGIAKAPYVVEFMKMLLDSGEKVVLFGWHRAVYGIWLEGLAAFNPVLYTGTESATQKAAAVDAFVNGNAQVLIMSLRSGAGVDGLQSVCSTAVFGELDWSPGVAEQCIGRVDRDGQDTPCNAYFLVSEAGADPIMAEVLGVKREQIEGVRNPDAELIERIESGENNIRRLAEQFLTKRGETAGKEGA